MHLSIRNIHIKKELRSLELVASQLGDELEEFLHESRNQVIALRNTPPIDGIIRARKAFGVDPYDGTSEGLWRERLEAIFTGLLKSYPKYSQIRYIGVAEGGKELVRVDRMNHDGSIRIVPKDQLQPKGTMKYFQETLEKNPDEVYISDFELNREEGYIQTPHFPTIRLAIPVYENPGVPFGMVIINLDLRNILDRISKKALPSSTLLIINENGDYLYSPDESKNWGFEYGKHGLAFEDFPTLRKITKVSEGRSGSYIKEDTAVAHRRVDIKGGQSVFTVVSVPKATIMELLQKITQTIVAVGTTITLLAILIGAYGSNLIASPIERIISSVKNYHFREPITIRKSRVHEVQELADIIENLSKEIQTKTAALEQETIERVKANELAEAKSLFLANVSHEIRNPMNGIVGFVELLKETEMSELQAEYLSLIDTSAESLLHILNDVLELSKILSTGTPSLDPVEFNLKENLEKVVKTMTVKANEKGISLDHTIEDNVPKEILGDSWRLNQILVNLLSNGIKFTEKGGVSLRCFLDSDPGLETNSRVKLKFQVRDTGIGIAEDKLDAIFKDFTQADDSIARKFGGTGLGLSITKKLVECMQGTIEVQSQPGKGSTFAFSVIMNSI